MHGLNLYQLCSIMLLHSGQSVKHDVTCSFIQTNAYQQAQHEDQNYPLIIFLPNVLACNNMMGLACVYEATSCLSLNNLAISVRKLVPKYIECHLCFYRSTLMYTGVLLLIVVCTIMGPSYVHCLLWGLTPAHKMVPEY